MMLAKLFLDSGDQLLALHVGCVLCLVKLSSLNRRQIVNNYAFVFLGADFFVDASASAMFLRMYAARSERRKRRSRRGPTRTHRSCPLVVQRRSETFETPRYAAASSSVMSPVSDMKESLSNLISRTRSENAGSTRFAGRFLTYLPIPPRFSL